MQISYLGDGSEQRPPLTAAELPAPQPGAAEIRVRVTICGVCHTELDEAEGRTPPPVLPVVPGHQVVGVVDALGEGCTRFARGDRVGVAWIFSACGVCAYCRRGLENLCPEFRATGRDANGGYAECMIVPEAFAYAIPAALSDAAAAPLLCAGAVGYRSLRLTGLQDGQSLGLTGFGASAHLVLQAARFLFPSSRVYVFARSASEREFARELGAAWAGGTEEAPPELLDAVIDTTPAWRPVVAALAALAPGGAAGHQRDSEDGRRPAGAARSLVPRAPVDGEGDQERGERHAARRGGVPRSCGPDGAVAGGTGVSA